MKQVADQAPSSGKVYKRAAIALGTFLGGLIATGYFFAENFKTLGQPEKVKRTWVITTIVTVVIGVIIFLIPENINIPTRAITYAYPGASLGFFKAYQEKQVQAYITQGGLVHSWLRVIGMSLLFGAIFLACVGIVIAWMLIV